MSRSRRRSCRISSKRSPAAGVRRVAIHARKAWLQGLSPKENRDIPPLDCPLVYRMKADFPHLHLSINGGIGSWQEAQAHLDAGMDGVMIGRAAYHTPFDILGTADAAIFGDTSPGRSAEEVVLAMLPYIEAHLAPVGGCSRSRATCWACSRAGRARAAGSASCRRAPIATARGRIWWNAR
jgi:tRNA dihydrouridine synthase A